MKNQYEYKNKIWIANLKEIESFCEDYNIYIYGKGEYGTFLNEYLIEIDKKVKGYVVSNGKKKDLDNDVFEIEELADDIEDKNQIVIVICSGGGYSREMRETAKKYGFGKVIELKVDQISPMPKPFGSNNNKEQLLSDFRGGLLRLRITNRCPGKCDFCGQRSWSIEEQNLEMDPKWYFEYLKPLYPMLKQILVTGGDGFYSKESYRYMKYISDNYPHITIMTESNGITFQEKFQKLACDNLFITHFSVNASNQETFIKGCWSESGGENAYRTIRANIGSYLDLLNENNRLEFAPNVSMVINSRTYDDVENFIRMCLELKLSFASFYFDYTESDMESDYFLVPLPARKALKKLMELEKLLKDRFLVQYRLWVPLKELDLMENELVDIGFDELVNKYPDIWDLAKNRSVSGENKKRNILRRKYGKQELNYNDEYSATLWVDTIDGKKICRNPWKQLDLYPSGRLDFCGWHVPTLYFPAYITETGVDWDKIINSDILKKYRNMMVNGDYEGCMKCCPMIREMNVGEV